MKRKRKNMAKRETAKTNNDESYYKNFKKIVCCPK